MPTFSLDIGISPQSISELEDCTLLLKWRTGMAMSREEIEKLATVLANFDSENLALTRKSWDV